MISIIIPVYNDPKGLDDTLASLVKQDYSKYEYEIIVADNGSTDNTIQVVREYVRDWPNLVQIVIEDKIQSSYAARNRGVEAARGEIISFVDADMTVKPTWLRQIHKVFENQPHDYVACNVRMYSTRKSAASLYNILTDLNIKNFMEKGHYAATCSLSVRKEVFDLIGTFDGRLESGGDTEFGNRAWNAILKFHYAENIIMYHPARGTLKSLLKKTYRIGRGGRGQLSTLYPERYGHFKWIYLNYRRYLPRDPRSIRKTFRYGYTFNRWTVLKFSVWPTLMHWVSLVGFLETRLRHLLKAAR